MAETLAERARQIRGKRSQKAFAALLTKAAEDLGFTHVYTENMVSKMETEYRQLQIEDFAVYEAVAPRGITWFWLAFGRERKRATEPREQRVG